MTVRGWDLDGTLITEELGVPIVEAVNKVREHIALGYKLILITARTENFEDDTEKDLKWCGLEGVFAAIEHHPNPFDMPWDPVAFKAQVMRKHGVVEYHGNTDTDKKAAELAGALFVGWGDMR